jgi:hypothetical protein
MHDFRNIKSKYIKKWKEETWVAVVVDKSCGKEIY